MLKYKNTKKSKLTMAHAIMPQDANPAGITHGGIVLKHIDDIAGIVAIRHCNGLAVTASIDRVDFYHPVLIGNLLILKASINYTGRSSMEVGVRVEAEDPVSGVVKHTASAYTTFVALNKNFKPTIVPQLILSNKTEKKRYLDAISRKELRLKLCKGKNRK